MAGTNKKKQPYTFATFRGELTTVAVGTAGGLLFTWLHIPGGGMSGSVVAVALLCGFATATPLSAPLRILALASMGVSIGSVVGPDTFSSMAAYPATMALMAVCVVAMTLASAAVWKVFMGWPMAMSILSSVPGSMSYIVSVSMGLGADSARVAVVQMSRVIFLVTLLPFIVVWESGGHLGTFAPPQTDSISVVVPTLALGMVAGHLLTRLGMAGGMLFGALITSGALHYFGFGEGRVPLWMLNAGQILLGSWVGTRFIDFDWRLFGKIAIGTTASVGAAMVVSVLFAVIVAAFFGVSFGTALIAYAPGGQDAMMVLALSLGVDPIFVSAHHLARYFLINLTLPFLIAYMQRARKADQTGDLR